MVIDRKGGGGEGQSDRANWYGPNNLEFRRRIL
jgi:hypothetical protein